MPGRGVSAPGGCLVGGVSAPRGYIPACTEADTPPVDRQMPVKILPWPNFVAAGNNFFRKCPVRYKCKWDLMHYYLLPCNNAGFKWFPA